MVYSPKEARKKGYLCPVCGKKLTVGVMSRVEHLAASNVEIETEVDKFGVRWLAKQGSKRPPYVMLVPLLEILSEALNSGVATQKVMLLYEQLINSLGSEFEILLTTPLVDIERVAGHVVAEAIKKVRSGDIVIKPGYDGVFGQVKIWPKAETPDKQALSSQESLF